MTQVLTEVAAPSLTELLDLTGKTAIVTGGAMGIGRGIALRLHEAGANVVVADRADEQAAETVRFLEERREASAHAVWTDVADAKSVEAMFATAIEEFDSIDILVNNAGIFPFVPLVSLSEDEFMRVIDVNLRGVFLCTKHAAARMIDQGRGGKIINVTSIDALHPSLVGLAAYDASKHAVWGFTKNVALELAPHRIWVNAIAPGGVLTPGVAAVQAAPDESGEAVDDMTSMVPMGRFADPDEIGRVALFLASDLSSYLTGTQIVADGGMLLT